MPTHPDFAAHCADLFASIGTVHTKRMFGGYGVYVDDVFVAIVTGDSLYLKTDEQTQARFAQAGGEQFSFTARAKVQATHFWTPPAEAMDSPALMRPWARMAWEAALRARAGAKRKKAR